MIIVIDLETTANGGVESNDPSAEYPENKVLLAGWRLEDGVSAVRTGSVQELILDIEKYQDDAQGVTLVGHNIMFDLKYLMRDSKKYVTINWNRINVWDTGYYWYRQSGHVAKTPSLEDTAKSYGISFKKSIDLKSYLNSGGKMEDIDIEELRTYLIGDIITTHDIYHIQEKERDPVHQKHLIPLAEMELNGLPIDRPALVASSDSIFNDLCAVQKKLEQYVASKLMRTDSKKATVTAPCRLSDLVDIKPLAPRTLSMILTGHTTTIKGQRANIQYDLMEAQELLVKKYVTGIETKAIWDNKLSPTLGYSMNEDKLRQLSHRLRHIPDKDYLTFIDNMLLYRTLCKMYNTYCRAFLAATAIGDCKVHPSINTTVTSTGRCSSSNPNGQNLPSEIRQLVKSMNGNIVEIDFKQLEVVVLAHLSKDTTLCNDIVRGEDIHYNTGKTVFKWRSPNDMTDADRKIVKGVNFGIIYGGKAFALSQQTGCDIQVVQKLIDAFYARYPGVKKWQADFYKQVVHNMKPAGIKNGEQIYKSMVELPESGRKFLFVEKESPDWLRKKTGRKYSFKPTETKNYPVQGFAGGDLVMVFLSYLYDIILETLPSHSKTDFIMTVHDSIVLDTDMDVYTLHEVVEHAAIQTQDWFEMELALRVDCSIGPNWK